MPTPSISSTNILLTTLARLDPHRCLTHFHSLLRTPTRPNHITLTILLPVSARLRSHLTQSLHSYSLKSALTSHTTVSNALISAYAKSLLPSLAIFAFRFAVSKDVVSWNALISGLSLNRLLRCALDVFVEMISLDYKPNYSTLSTVLAICDLAGLNWGREIHAYAVRGGIVEDVAVGNAIVAFYGRVGEVEMAEEVFEGMLVKDVVSWNSLVAALVGNGRRGRVLEVFDEMGTRGIEMDVVTLKSVLPVCALMRDVGRGRRIHELVRKCPLVFRETSVLNALVSFYGRIGEVDEALRVFESISKCDLVSWNAMLTAYVNNERWMELVGLFRVMVGNGIRPDSVSLLSALQACAVLNATMVREIHAFSIKTNLICVSTVGNALVNAYAKCGCIECALKTFKNLSNSNLVSNNTMISAFVNHGLVEEAEKIFARMQYRDLSTWNLLTYGYVQNNRLDQAIVVFCEMQSFGMRPDAVSVTGILPVCACLASLCLVKQCHGYTIRASLEDLLLEGALLDTYAKCGSIKSAHKLFISNPQNDIVTFTAMIGGFAMNGMAEEALQVFSEMLEMGIKPDHVIMTALLSACSHAGFVDVGRKHFESIDLVHGIEYTMEHYACLADLLARRGWVKEAYAYITSMPCKPGASVWGALLGACKVHGEMKIALLAAESLSEIDGGDIGNHVVMSNIYAADGKWEGVEEVRALMKSKELKKPAGCSWIEVEKGRHVFIAGDVFHPQRLLIQLLLKALDKHMKEPLTEGSTKFKCDLQLIWL